MSYASKLFAAVVALATLAAVPAACGSSSSGTGGPPPPGNTGAGGSGSPTGTGAGGGGSQTQSCTGAVTHTSPASPVEYGENEVATTLAAAGSHANVCVLTADKPPAQAAL